MIQLASCYTSQPQLWTAGSGEEESGAEAEWGEGEGSQLWALHQDEGDDPGAGPRETGSCREVTHSFFLLKWDLIPLWCTLLCFIGEMLCVQGWEDSAAVQGWRGESCPDRAHAGAHISHRATHQPASAAPPTARVLHYTFTFKQYDWKLHNNLHKACRSWLLLTPVHPQVKAGWSRSGGVSCAGMLHFCLQRERQAGGKAPKQAWRTEEIDRKWGKH